MPTKPSTPECEPPDLSQRYRMQVFFPELDEEDDWDTINSFPTPAQALRGCSECLEAVKGMLGIPYGKDLGNDYVRLRIVDAETKTLLLWDDESGALWGDLSAFAPPDAELIGHRSKSR